MIQALYAAASGMQAQQRQVEAVAANLANVNTAGYKRVRPQFADLVYHLAAGDAVAAPQPVASGVRMAATVRIFTPGILQSTGTPTDLAIEGEGFFRLRGRDGQELYTRDGAFRLDARRRLVSAAGLPVLDAAGSEVVIPAAAATWQVAADGTVHYQDPATGEAVTVARLGLALVANPDGLEALGDHLLAATPVAGPVRIALPGEGGAGSVRQGFLEQANVDVVNEMVSLILAQRAYEMNSKALQGADEMYSLANNLRRG